MRRRHRHGLNVRDFVSKDLCATVNKLMDNRRRLLAPFPLDPDVLYEMVWTPKELDAMEVLSKHSDMLHMSSTFKLVKPKSELVIHVHLPQGRPGNGYRSEIAWSRVPKEAQELILEWGKEWLALHKQQNQLINKLEDLSKQCNTYGQLYRLWPDLLGFFGERGKEKVEAAQMKSKLPDGVLIVDYNEEGHRATVVLKEAYRPEAFEPFSTVIAECLMLPTHEGKEVATISN